MKHDEKHTCLSVYKVVHILRCFYFIYLFFLYWPVFFFFRQGQAVLNNSKLCTRGDSNHCHCAGLALGVAVLFLIGIVFVTCNFWLKITLPFIKPDVTRMPLPFYNIWINDRHSAFTVTRHQCWVTLSPPTTATTWFSVATV